MRPETVKHESDEIKKLLAVPLDHLSSSYFPPLYPLSRAGGIC